MAFCKYCDAQVEITLKPYGWVFTQHERKHPHTREWDRCYGVGKPLDGVI